MPAPDPHRTGHPVQDGEQGARWALLPIAATLGYYALPAALQTQRAIQFLPQILAYVGLACWARHHRSIWPLIGLRPHTLWPGVRWGVAVGLALGTVNTILILNAFPAWGQDIQFLTDIPHAHIPILIMVPWFIAAIAILAELNFRGFLLGRLAAWESAYRPSTSHLSPLALLGSTLTFAFDPFIVATFQSLHWIAAWDGLIWGLLWLHTRNLATTITAHAVEVLVIYLAVRTALG